MVILADGERVPFLRGILTRSIQDAGLGFEDSYRLATKVRDELREVNEIATKELRARVAVHLRPLGQPVVDRFMRPEMPTILVREPGGEASPYSRGRHRLRLEACGLQPTEATETAGLIQERFTSQGLEEVSSMDLRRLTYQRLKTAYGDAAARHFLVWEEFVDAGAPLLLLLGGATGTGKSSIASQVAHQFEIVRTQPTDMLREVMRMMIPKSLLPVLHTSTFLAHQELPFPGNSGEDADTRLANGYLMQARLLTTGCSALVQRAVSERRSLILEGVHVNPQWMMSVAKESSDVIVAPVMLAVLRRDALRARLRGRGREARDRRAQRYLKHFDQIWSLQSFLLAEADRCDVPIVSNGDRERAVRQVLASVTQAMGKRYEGSTKVLDGAG